MGISKEDLIKILSRDPDLEIARLWDGICGQNVKRDHWSWEQRYKLKFSNPITTDELRSAYEAGMLPKDVLKDGQYYWGLCRNARVARWSSAQKTFRYQRKKGTWLTTSILYPTDASEHEDFFTPWIEVEPLPHEVV